MSRLEMIGERECGKMILQRPENPLSLLAIHMTLRPLVREKRNIVTFICPHTLHTFFNNHLSI
jgi:hypothetical protein